MQLVVGEEMQLSRERSQEVKMNKSRVGRMTQTVVHEPQPRNSFPGKNLVLSITFNCTEQNKKEKKSFMMTLDNNLTLQHLLLIATMGGVCCCCHETVTHGNAKQTAF